MQLEGNYKSSCVRVQITIPNQIKHIVIQAWLGQS